MNFSFLTLLFNDEDHLHINDLSTFSFFSSGSVSLCNNDLSCSQSIIIRSFTTPKFGLIFFF